MTDSIQEALRAQKDLRMRLLFNYWETVKRDIDKDEFPIDKALRGDKDLLDDEISREIRKFFVFVLELLECGLADHKELYEKIRPKILRGGNDAIRNLSEALANYHTLKVAETKTIFKWNNETEGKGK